jgi:DNA-binding winged helix-turn-helix (wHTH) protein
VNFLENFAAKRLIECMAYLFADCALDPDRHELTREGGTIHVEPQVFDILVLLAQNSGDLVSRDDLIAGVWKGLIVSESTISARINAARSADGDNGKDQRIIKTVPRRGFKMIAPVETTTPGAARGPVQAASTRQDVRFATSADGMKIAFARSGNGPALVRVGHWLSHLELDWHSPVWRPLLDALGRRHSVHRYDQRGTGLSGLDALACASCDTLRWLMLSLPSAI